MTELPLERLEIEMMASGLESLRLTDRVQWEDFPEYASAVITLLGGTIVARAGAPTERVWTTSVQGCLFWISLDDFGLGVALDRQNADGARLIPEIRRILLGSRGAAKQS